MPAKMIDGPPNTQRSLRRDLSKIGIGQEMTMMVHSSLSSIGWVLGGAPTVIRALLDVVGEEGTLIMPAATPRCADPAAWTDPQIPEVWHGEVREHLPAFDRKTTATTLGAIPEAFRTWPGVLRSGHPLESVCAIGPLASAITEEHPLAFSEGRGSPLGKLHELNCWILLLGVGFNRCTALHFAESLMERRRTTQVRFPAWKNGRRVWIEVENVADDNDTHFPIIGETYVAAGRAREGSVGKAPATLVRMRDLVDFAMAYFDTIL